MAVGGAGLYFRGLVDGLFDGPGADAEIRAKLQREADEHGNVALHERLRQCDPETADRVHPNNRVKVIRALEVYELTGETHFCAPTAVENEMNRVTRFGRSGLTCRVRCFIGGLKIAWMRW